MHDQRASCCVHTGPGTLLPDGDTLAIAGFALQAVRIYVFLLPLPTLRFVGLDGGADRLVRRRRGPSRGNVRSL